MFNVKIWKLSLKAVLVLSFLLLLLSSCAISVNPFNEIDASNPITAEYGDLSITIPSNRSWNINSYRVEATKQGEIPVVVSTQNSSVSMHLLLGDWNISVEAKDESGNSIFMGGRTITVTEGSNQETIAIIKNAGNIELSISNLSGYTSDANQPGHIEKIVATATRNGFDTVTKEVNSFDDLVFLTGLANGDWNILLEGKGYAINPTNYTFDTNSFVTYLSEEFIISVPSCKKINSSKQFTHQKQVTPVIFSKSSGEYSNSFDLSLSTLTNGAVIQYQLDSGNWQTYSTPITIDANHTVKAKASKSGIDNESIIGERTYTINSVDSLTVHFKLPSGWGAPKIYAWTGTTTVVEYCGGWSGTAMVEEGNGWYKYTISGITSCNLIFNDGSNQTADLSRESEGWYDGTWHDSNPDGPVPASVSANPPGGYFVDSPLTITLSVSASTGTTLQSAKYTIDGSDPVVSGTLFTNDSTIQIGSGMNDGDTKVVKLWAKAIDDSTSQLVESTQEYTFTKVNEIPRQTFSWDNATVYFVMTDRFYNGNTNNDHSYGRQNDDAHQNVGTFHGGDIQGLTDKLNAGYFNNLGVNAIWITAPYEQIHGWAEGKNSSFKHYGYHGYYALDFTCMDQNMGTSDDLRTFINTAHEKGIRVIFDIVMNHAGYATHTDLHELGVDVLLPGWENADLGSYHDTIDYNSNNWVNWWGPNWVRAGFPGYQAPNGTDGLTGNVGYLPDFITEATSPAGLPVFAANKPSTNMVEIPNYTVRQYLIKWLSDWVREYGVDGFRCDTAKHVEKEAWAQLKTATNQAFDDWKSSHASYLNDIKGVYVPSDDFWMTGEHWNWGSGGSVGKDDYFTHGFDSMINFGFLDRVSGNYDNPEGTFSYYASAINNDTTFNVLHYISSHDTGQVFYSAHGSNHTTQKKIGTVLLLSPGAVQIFYGDEIGRDNGPGGDDPDQGSRSDFQWDKVGNDINLHWNLIGQFRNKHIAIGAGTHNKISDGPYTFSRVKDNDKVVCVIGASGSTTVNVSSVFANGVTLRDWYTKDTAVVSGGNVTFNADANGVILIEEAN